MDDAVPELRPVSDGARDSIEGANTIKLIRFPFRFGRESRYTLVNGKRVSMERRLTASKPNNEVYLLDLHEVMNVSREHCQINRNADGSYAVVDRGSTCGTIVDGVHIGTREGSNQAPIAHGGQLILGTTDSPFVFEFRASADEDR